MKTDLVQNYRIFEGRYNEQMPLLVQESLTPLTAKDVMEYRIKAVQSKNIDEIYFWLKCHWDTITGLAHFNGQLIVVPNSELLSNINPESRLVNGSLPLTIDQYKELSKKYEVIRRDKVISGRDLTEKQAKEHLIWLKLAQDDKALLDEYAGLVLFSKAKRVQGYKALLIEYAGLIFSKAKRVYGYNVNMGIYLPKDQENPALRSWRLKHLNHRSGASVKIDLGNYTRLFGACAQNSSSDPSLEALVAQQGKN